MHLKSIEPTPNPNNMKLNLEESLPPGVKHSYSADAPASDQAQYPPAIRRVLAIPGVKSLFHSLDFIALQRVPTADWQAVLSQAREILSGETAGEGKPMEATPDLESVGQVRIFIQHFRRIPMLVKVQGPSKGTSTGSVTLEGTPETVSTSVVEPVETTMEEIRINLPPRFAAAVKEATPSAPNMLIERRWVSVEPRYGELKEVGEAVAAEIDASYPEARLQALVKQAFELGAEKPDVVETRRRFTDEERDALLASSDWKQRYAAVESLGPDPVRFAELATAMKDPHISVRRLATIYLGLLKTPETMDPLIAALKDPAAVIRRTAGDALNDIAPAPPERSRAIAAMIEALGDKNKLVRWRAARFLYELGDATALSALKIAAEAPEFEVRLQAAQAVERIEGGKPAAGPIWMQMVKK
jgi:hypothetical protein